MYVWKLKTVLDLFRKFRPKTYKICKKAAAGQGEANYAKLEKMTVESAITTRAPKIAMVVSRELGWSDLGKWHIIANILPSDKKGNVTRGQVVCLNTKNSLVYGSGDKLIAAIGLDNMIVVFKDNALLVCPKDSSSEVKKIIEGLKKSKFKKFI
jgi:mannose-1-phosphate guanylyltransferase